MDKTGRNEQIFDKMDKYDQHGQKLDKMDKDWFVGKIGLNWRSWTKLDIELDQDGQKFD